MNVIYYILLLTLISLVFYFRIVEGFDNNYTNYIPPIYTKEAIKSKNIHKFGFHKGKGSYKKEQLKDKKSDDKLSVLNELLDKLLNRIVSDTQDCVGSFGKYSECDKSCGTGGYQTRKYEITQEKGINGKACRVDEGVEEKIPCYIRDCNENEECEVNLDCRSGNCEPDKKTCGPEVYCSKENLHVCSQDECRILNENNINNSNVLEGKYLYETNSEKCFFKTPAEIEELNINIYSYNYENPESYAVKQICSYYENSDPDTGGCKLKENIVMDGDYPKCVLGRKPEPTLLNIDKACDTCIITGAVDEIQCKCPENEFLNENNECIENRTIDGREADCQWFEKYDDGICRECEPNLLTTKGMNELCEQDYNIRNATNCNGYIPDNDDDLNNVNCSVNVCNDVDKFLGWGNTICKSSIEVICPPGQYLDSGSNVCEYCLPGNYCPGGNDVECSPGSSNEAGVGICKCQEKTYNPNTGSDSPDDCMTCGNQLSGRGSVSCGNNAFSCGRGDYIDNIDSGDADQNYCDCDIGFYFNEQENILAQFENINQSQNMLNSLDPKDRSEELNQLTCIELPDNFPWFRSDANNPRFRYCSDQVNCGVHSDDNLLENACIQSSGEWVRRCVSGPEVGKYINSDGIITDCESQPNCAPGGDVLNPVDCVMKVDITDDGSMYKQCSSANDGYIVNDYGQVVPCSSCQDGQYVDSECVSNGETQTNTICKPDTAHPECPSDAVIGVENYPGAGTNRSCSQYHPSENEGCDNLYEEVVWSGETILYRRCGRATGIDWYHAWDDKSFTPGWGFTREYWEKHCVSDSTNEYLCYSPTGLPQSNTAFISP